MRERPYFGKKASFETQLQNDNSPGCIRMLLFSVGGYFVFSAITKVTSGRGSEIDQYICYGALICFVVILLIAARGADRDRNAREEEEQKWKSTCISTEVAILSRDYSPGGESDDGYDIHYYRESYRLSLDMDIDKGSIVPNRRIVKVEVAGYIYKKLEKRDTVRIYYHAENPMTFLLEEEM
jgi:hypothetical protein